MKIETKHSVGDIVYEAAVQWKRGVEPCPDCGGAKTWEACPPCGDPIMIACPTCTYGQETRGYVETGSVSGSVRSLTIGRVNVEVGSDHAESYMCEETGVGSGQVWYPEKFYATHADAEAALPGLLEAERVKREEQHATSRDRKIADGPGRMAAYYRAQIRDAEKSIAMAARGLAREAGK